MEVNKKKSVKGLLNKGKVIQKAKFVGGYTDNDKEISERVAASEKAFHADTDVQSMGSTF